MNAIEITTAIIPEVDARYPMAFTEHRTQRIGHDDCPSCAHTRQTRTLRLDSSSSCHARAHRTPLQKQHRRRDHPWQSVYAQDRHTLLHVRYDLDAGEGIRKQLVRGEDRINLPSYAPWALAPDVGEEHERRGRPGMSWAKRSTTYVKKNLSMQVPDTSGS